MPAAIKTKELDLKRAILETYAVNERANQYLLESLDERAWRAEPPGGKGRTAAAIAAHMHNVRHMWLVAAAKELEIPDKLEPADCTRKQAMAALTKSAACCSRMLELALARPDGKVKGFRPDVVGMLGYLISHDAHHRGQICVLARQAGFPLLKQAGFGMWEWGTLWKQCGFGD
ncbi:MAG TPA: DinB family protein [Bryobacteraceae bacterium]|nr:DinB family protein [Bryobacteraceae bacterium]